MSQAAVASSPSEGSPATRNPFATARYRQWWAASIAAGLGVGIQLVTVPLFIRDRVAEDNRALALAGALICETLPGALLVLVGGVAADRMQRRLILVRAYAVAALVSLAFVFMAQGHVDTVWPVFPLAAAVGILGAFAQPARVSMIPQMLGRQQLQNGVILGTIAYMVAFQFGGPATGGLLADGPGLTIAFAAEVVFLALAALLFLRVPTDRPQPTGTSIRSDLVAGMRYVRESPALQGLLFLALLPGLFFIGPFGVTAVLMVDDVLKVSDAWLGILTACFGAGVITGSLLLILRPTPHRGFWLLLAPTAAGGGLVVFGASEQVEISMVALFAAGLAAAVFINLATTLLQETAELQLMGRVTSMYTLAFALATPVGYAQGGLVANFWGPQPALISSGLAFVGLGLLALAFLRPVRRME